MQKLKDLIKNNGGWTIVIFIAAIFLVFVLASCSGQSEAEDAKTAEVDSMAMFVESKFSILSNDEMGEICDLAKTTSLTLVVQMAVTESGDDTPEFKNAVENFLSEECKL